MNFAWTSEQEAAFQATLAFCRTRLDGPPDGHFNRAHWREAGRFGLMGLCVPASLGGAGLGALETARAFEAFGQGTRDSGLVFSAAAHLFACCMPIAEVADPAVAAEYVPGLASGELIGANAITEAEAGSDVYALKTRAVSDGDAYVLDGEKLYVTNGPIADVFLVYATVNPRHGFLGVTAFVVRRDTPGLVIGKPFEKIGLRGSPMCSIYLQGCRLPARQMVGRAGGGARTFTASMRWERACLFGLYVGVMQRQLDRCIAHANQRKQGGRSIGRHQGVSHRIVNMKLRLEAARLLLYRACWALDHAPEGDADVAVSLAKLAVSEAAVASGLDAIQIHGGEGVISEVGVEEALRDAIPSTIFSGTSEIQRNLVARGLGL